MTTELPEERQVAALRRVAELGARKRRLQAELDEVMAAMRPAVLAAHEAGVTAQRIIQVSGLGRGTLYAWLPPEARKRGRSNT